MKNLFSNFFKKKYFFLILKKIIKRFEKNTYLEAEQWAKLNTIYTTDQFCQIIDAELFNHIKSDIKSIQEESEKKLSELKISLGGGGNYLLLYFLTRKLKPLNVVETGVAAGWSSLAILRALKKNGIGRLFSSDFTYFRLKNPEEYIGLLAKNEINKENWFLDIRGDDIALPEIVKILGKKKIDLFHYDSDKSYSGRVNALKNLEDNFTSQTVIIFDDIQDNLQFRDYVYQNKKNFYVLKFEEKYVGITGKNLF